MTADEVDAFFKHGRRTLPAVPDWREGNRLGERRSRLIVSLDGADSPIKLCMTIRLDDQNYFMGLLLCGRRVVCRLCMTTSHRDRITGREVKEPHFHGWQANRVGKSYIPKNIDLYELVPQGVSGRSDAFAWFLNRNAIDVPLWAADAWPRSEGLF